MNDPYKSGMFQGNPYFDKRTVESSLCVILDGRFEQRGLQLIPQMSRALKKNEVHELIISDEEGISPGSRVDKIAYIGFTEIETGGVIIKGDEVLCDGMLIGTIAGFDETHMPNHQNIVISGERKSGADRALQLGSRISFRHVKP